MFLLQFLSPPNADIVCFVRFDENQKVSASGSFFASHRCPRKSIQCPNMKFPNQVASTSGPEIQMFFEKSDTCPGRIFLWEKSSMYKVPQVSQVTGSGS